MEDKKFKFIDGLMLFLAILGLYFNGKDTIKYGKKLYNSRKRS